MRFFLSFIVLMSTAVLTLPVAAQPMPTQAGDVDLILPPALASKNAPFYQGASLKVGDKVYPVKEAATTNGQLVEFQPDKNQIAINSTSAASETEKGQALLNTVTAMQVSGIATAAGK